MSGVAWSGLDGFDFKKLQSGDREKGEFCTTVRAGIDHLIAGPSRTETDSNRLDTIRSENVLALGAKLRGINFWVQLGWIFDSLHGCLGDRKFQLSKLGVDFREQLQVETEVQPQQAGVEEQAKAEEDDEEAEEVEGV